MLLPNTPGSRDSQVRNILRSIGFLVYLVQYQQVFFANYISCWYQINQEKIRTPLHVHHCESLWKLKSHFTSFFRVQYTVLFTGAIFIKWTVCYFNNLVTWGSCLRKSQILRNNNWIPIDENTRESLKGAQAWDFRLRFFCFKITHLVPWYITENSFEYKFEFAEIFD